MDNFINTLKNYADFASRTGRNDYWMFMLLYVVLSVVTGIVDSILGILLVNSIYSLVIVVFGSYSFLFRSLGYSCSFGFWLRRATVKMSLANRVSKTI